MTIKVTATIEGLQQAQDANLRVIAAMQPAGATGEATRWLLTAAHRVLVTITHVDTGAYRASHRMVLTEVRGVIGVDEGATNPRTGKRVSSYAKIEEARGGEHAAYYRTAEDYGPGLLRQSGEIILRALP
jgi:hypothetical protein